MTLTRPESKLLIALFLLLLVSLSPLSALAVDSPDSGKGMSARERFYQKYRNKKASDAKSPDASVNDSRMKNMEDRKRAIEQRRQELKKRRAERRQLRRDRMDAETDRMQGKAPAVEKKEKERLDTRRRALQDRVRARRESYDAKRQKRHKDVMEKSGDMDPGNPDAGYTGQAGGGATKRSVSPEIEERRRKIEERRQAILEKNRLRREQRDADRRIRREGRTRSRDASPDSVPNAHVSGSDTIPPPPRSHISGAPTGSDHLAPDPHISGN